MLEKHGKWPKAACFPRVGRELSVALVHTVWPEILAGRYFGRLLKLWHLAELTLAVEKVLAIIIFYIWVIEHAGNLTGPWASFNRSYYSDTETENRLPVFLGKWPTTHQQRSLQRLRACHLDCVDKPTLLPPLVSKTLWRSGIVRMCLNFR